MESGKVCINISRVSYGGDRNLQRWGERVRLNPTALEGRISELMFRNVPGPRDKIRNNIVPAPIGITGMRFKEMPSDE
jgi:hypothetical protein